MSGAPVPETKRSRPVAAPAVERELQALWREESEARHKAAPAGKPLGRSLLHTLVVYAPDAQAAELAAQVVASLTRRQPSRSILLVSSTAAAPAPDDLAASVTLHCVGAEDGHDTICCEQVLLAAPGAAARRIPGAVLPLLLTNVPSFLWWTRGSPFRNPILRDLSTGIDRLIVDSFSFASPESDLAEMAKTLADPSFHTIVSDLSWARLAVWRYNTAQIFDAANTRSYLSRIVRARLRYFAGTPMLAWLFGGWLASRLGWRAVEQDPRSVRCAEGQVVEYEARPPDDSAQAGYFAGVTLTADDGSEFDVTRRSGGFTESRVKIGGFKTERVVPMREETTTEYLGHELGRLSATPTYEAALRQLVDASRAGRAPVG